MRISDWSSDVCSSDIVTGYTMKLMSGNSNLPVAQAIANYIELPLIDESVRRFADAEIFVKIHENVRGEDIFVIQSTSYPKLEEHTSVFQVPMSLSYADYCLKKK